MSTEIRFYHMEKSTLETTLPALLSKAYAQGNKIIVKTLDTEKTETLNGYLWTYNPNNFLPHGSQKDGNVEHQPIFLTDKEENPNGANVLILVDGAETENLNNYDLCCQMLNGHDQTQIQKARENWKLYKEQGLNITYWQQDEKGSWIKKS